MPAQSINKIQQTFNQIGQTFNLQLPIIQAVGSSVMVLMIYQYLEAVLFSQEKSIVYNQLMQNSVCKRIAKSFLLQRYIPEYQVYELCISWESEIPIPPTIFYLSEIFIYPYTVHELPSLKNELPPNKFFIDSDTLLDHDNSTALQRTSKSQFGSLGAATIEHESKTENPRVLDYDRMLMSNTTLSDIKARNRQIVKRNDLKTADGRKRRKT